MKQLVISKTIMFIIVLLYIGIFQTLFGSAYTLIGVASIVALLMFLERDLTVTPWKNLFFLVGYNVFQGLSAYIALENKWLGVILIFVTFFSVGYLFTFNLKKPLYVPFGLQYVFLLFSNATAEQLPKQLIALAFSGVLIMLVQLVVNRNKLQLKGKKTFIAVCDDLIQKIKHKEAVTQTKNDASIHEKLKDLRKAIYDRREVGFYLTLEGRLKLNATACLESLQEELNEMLRIHQEQRDIFLEYVEEELQNVKQFSKGEVKTDCKLSQMRKFAEETNVDTKLETVYYEVIGTFELLYENLAHIQKLDKTTKDFTDQTIPVPKSFRNAFRFFADFSTDSVRFTYALRLAIVTTIGFSLWQFLNLENGRWIMITMFSVTQPYSEISKFRSKDRLIATLIGIVVFLVLFSIFKDTTVRTLLIMAAGYINSYITKYRYSTIGVTVMALGGASILGGEVLFSLDRLLYTLLGIGLAVLANQYVLPYSLKEGTTKLVQMYKKVTEVMMKEIRHGLEGRSKGEALEHLFTLTAHIEDRIMLNASAMEWKHYNRFLNEQRVLNSSIFKLYLKVQRDEENKVYLKTILDELQANKADTMVKFTHVIEQLRDELYHTKDNKKRMIIVNLIEVFERFRSFGSTV